MNRIRYYLFHEYIGEESYDTITCAEGRVKEICQGLKLDCYYVYFESDEPDSDYREVVFFEGIQGYTLRANGEDKVFGTYDEGLAAFFDYIQTTCYPCVLESGNGTFQLTLDYERW